MKNEHVHAVVLFDGVCNFCNSRINFIIRHDTKDHFRYAALQSEAGKKLLREHHISENYIDSFVLVEGEKVTYQTTAALRIARKLNGLWPVFYAFIIVPPFLRNIVYHIIAKNRYRWWGQRASCMIPTPEVRKKFLG